MRAFGVACVLMTTTVARLASQVTYDGCTDHRGRLVASVLDNSINDVAIASLTSTGAPVIHYNPKVLVSITPKVQLFFYAHECGHHVLGQLPGTPTKTKEQEADCWAINTLVDEGYFDDDDVTEAQKVISSFGPGDWSHLPGPQRAINLKKCLGRQDDDNGKGDQTDNQQRCTNAINECAAVGCPCDGLVGLPFVQCRDQCNACLARARVICSSSDRNIRTIPELARLPMWLAPTTQSEPHFALFEALFRNCRTTTTAFSTAPLNR